MDIPRFFSIHQLVVLFIFLAIMNSPGVMIHVQVFCSNAYFQFGGVNI